MDIGKMDSREQVLKGANPGFGLSFQAKQAICGQDINALGFSVFKYEFPYILKTLFL